MIELREDPCTALRLVGRTSMSDLREDPNEQEQEEGHAHADGSEPAHDEPEGDDDVQLHGHGGFNRPE
jgi:hypothetical protein